MDHHPRAPEAKAQARIIDQFVDGQKAFSGLNTRDLYIRCYSRDKNHPDAESGPGRWMKFRMAGDPAWGDVAATFFNRQLQLWVTPPRGTTTAVKANDFLNSIGACTHIRQGEDDPAKVAECLTYIGIRAIRDDGTTDPKTLQSFIDIHRASGAKVVLLPINGDVAASLAEYETLAAAGALLAADGPNEPNNWHVTYQGGNLLEQDLPADRPLPGGFICRHEGRSQARRNSRFPFQRSGRIGAGQLRAAVPDHSQGRRLP